MLVALKKIFPHLRQHFLKAGIIFMPGSWHDGVHVVSSVGVSKQIDLRLVRLFLELPNGVVLFVGLSSAAAYYRAPVENHEL